MSNPVSSTVEETKLKDPNPVLDETAAGDKITNPVTLRQETVEIDAVVPEGTYVRETIGTISDQAGETAEYIAGKLSRGENVEPSTEVLSNSSQPQTASGLPNIGELAGKAWETVKNTAYSLEEKAAEGLHAITHTTQETAEKAKEVGKSGYDYAAEKAAGARDLAYDASAKTRDLAYDASAKTKHLASDATARTQEGLSNAAESVKASGIYAKDTAVEQAENVKSTLGAAVNKAESWIGYGANKTKDTTGAALESTGESMERQGQRLQEKGAAMRHEAGSKLAESDKKHVDAKVHDAKDAAHKKLHNVSNSTKDALNAFEP